MGRIHEGIKTINSVVRTTIVAVLCGILGFGGYLGYSEYTRHEKEIARAQAQVSELKEELQVKVQQLERLEASMRLLKTDRRLARLEVVGIERDADGKAVMSRVQFSELSPNGDPISSPKKFEVPGDMIYVDSWIVKFDDKFIEQEDIERGTSLCLFRSIYSEQMRAVDGFSLDTVGMRPQAYAHGGQLTEFEKKLWTDFWEFANDPKKAADMGIRAANGEAVYIKIKEGMNYQLELRSSGGISIKPIEPKALQPENAS